MGHELTFRNGRACMAYVGEVPWHGFGTNLGDKPVRSEVMYLAAQQDFVVVRKRLCMMQGDTLVPTDRIALVNGDSNTILGYASHEGYEDFQNWELYEILDGALGSRDMYETAGVLKQGQIVFLTVRLTGEHGITRIDGSKDEIDDYILASTGHDGRTAIILGPTRIRTVCWNTWSYATSLMKGKADVFWIAHNKGMRERIEQAKAAIAETYQMAREQRELEQWLAEQRMSHQEMRAFAERVLLDTAETIEKAKEAMGKVALGNHEERVEQVVDLAIHGKGNTGETMLDAFQGVTEFIDHHKKIYEKSVEAQRAGRLYGAWFGEGEKRKRKALNLLTRNR